MEVRGGKIIELRRAFSESPGGAGGWVGADDLRKKREIETEWGMLGESKAVNSADQIDQLASLRFDDQVKSKNLSREKKCMVRGEKFRMGAYNKYGSSAREVGIEAIGGGMAPFCEFHIRIYMRMNH